MFNPFDKQPDEALEESDLQHLIERQVAEGYYVEYKSVIQPPHKIAKSIAALANTYGGWYIVGVKTDNNSVANEICGFDPQPFHDLGGTVRDVAKGHISPTPILIPRVVTLSNGNVALVVRVPDEQDTPFITTDGRIYRRVNDSSDPVPERDRYAVDRLFNQGQARDKAFARFRRDARTFSRGERDAKQCWISLSLTPYPGVDGIFDERHNTLEFIEQLLHRAQAPVNLDLAPGEPTLQGSGALPFSVAHSTYRSIVLREAQARNMARNVLTMELFLGGAAKMHIPLTMVKPVDLSSVSPTVKTSSVRDVLHELRALDSIDSRDGIYGLRFFDVPSLWAVITLLIAFYQQWLDGYANVQGIKLAVDITNAWRLVPFVDGDDWATHVRSVGMPVNQNDTIALPGDESKGMIIDRDLDRLWLTVCGLVGESLGMSADLLGAAIAQGVQSPLG